MNDQNQPWKIWVDTGGTFTDCIAIDPEGVQHRVKVLSSSALRGTLGSPAGEKSYFINQDWEAPDNFIRGFRFRLLQQEEEVEVTGFNSSRSVIHLSHEITVDKNSSVSFEVISDEEAPTLAARLVTSTPAGKKLPSVQMRLATTRGTNALLENKGVPTALFVTKGFHDLLEIGNQQRSDLFALQVIKNKQVYDRVIEVPERINAKGEVIEPLRTESLEQQVKECLKDGIQSIAIALMNSYRNPEHEKVLEAWLIEKRFDHISVSSDLIRFIRIIPRAETTLVNAYLAPIIDQYLDSVSAAISDGNIFVMTSAGGLTKDTGYKPKDSLLSGPAGGVVGAATVGKNDGYEKVISFDMGGTSTDVARYENNYEYVFEHRVGNAHLVAPALSIETVAAGGGSICYFDGFKLCVGPESAGAHPGPACYGAGGPLTITDVNLLLGRLDAKNFHIPVVIEESENRLAEILKEVRQIRDEDVTREDILLGFLHIANERMADAIRKISIRKGYDTSEYALVAFGGAGAQHACSIARQLNMDTVLVSEHAGILSAWGLGHAVMEEFEEKQLLKPLMEVEFDLDQHVKTLSAGALEKLQKTIGNGTSEIGVRRAILSMRLEGQESTLEIEYDGDHKPLNLFKKAYIDRYGHWIDSRTIEVESIRVIASTNPQKSKKTNGNGQVNNCIPSFHKKVWFEGVKKEIPVYDRLKMEPGNQIKGPALVLDPHSTIVIEPGWNAAITNNGTTKLQKAESTGIENRETESEAVKLELFTNRFSSIAEEMGEMLQRTALSVNVKDRLDFSCALLNSKGELVVNAPHIPVHLGALGLCVRSLMEAIEMKPGDVIVTNHPAFGGAHLPDVTVVTPVYTDDEELIGYAASRAHHAEIGGTYPGSMPPDATSLLAEGVVIPPMKLIDRGNEQWKNIRKHLLSGPYPTRDIEENMADLQAAIAANHRGAEALRGMTVKYGTGQVRHYMNALKEHAATRMRSTLKSIPNGTFNSEEKLDDGTIINVTYTVKDEWIQIDFTGTGPVHPGNLNATPAIVNSVIMYVLRLLIDEPLPLNEGLLDPVEIILPTCFLNPEFHQDPAKCPAVVGGNVEVSQRLTDTLLKPFERVACSQGTMNNVLFGNDHFGYYETVGGGTGAGPDFNGTDAVHHHMTNTRGTDPEILEYRYPVRLDRYEVRHGSGGKGKYSGGSGILREMTFLEPVRLTVLTQHRVEEPYGLRGGEPGKRGEQLVIYKNGKKIQLNSVDGKDLEVGDRFILKTPGGGGFGKL